MPPLQQIKKKPNERRDILRVDRVEEMKTARRKRIYKRIAFSGTLLLILIGLVSAFSKHQKLLINDIVVSGNNIIEKKDIEQIINNSLSGNYVHLFARRDFLIYPKNKIERDLKEEFKRIINLNVSLLNYRTLSVDLTERKGEYLWCGDSFPEVDARSVISICYFSDSNGYIFDKAPYFSGNAYFKFYTGISDPNNPIGASALSTLEFKNILAFKNGLASFGILTDTFLINSDSDYEFLILAQGSINAPRIIFKKDQAYEKLLADLESALSAEPLATDFKAKLSSLEYLDLRYDNKVYYKFNK
ncbi:MAG: hypothetical protein WC795_01885 [Candidatus Paceibacterota bacterium]|jgi:hypothetical protein